MGSVAAEADEAVVLVALVEVGEAGLFFFGHELAGVHGAAAQEEEGCEWNEEKSLHEVRVAMRVVVLQLFAAGVFVGLLRLDGVSV